MSAIDEAIAYIDTLIETIIQEMILFRTKRLEASQKVLDKIKALMDATVYTYRLGDLLDKSVKVETDRLKHFDLTKPSLKIRYTGPKTRLWLNGNYIDVPEVPVFVFEPTNTDKAIHEMGVSMIERNIMIKFPLDANVAEPPDFENAYGKYYKLAYTGVPFEYLTINYLAGKKLAIFGFAFEVDTIEAYHSYRFERILTLGSEQHSFTVYAYYGKLIGKRFIDPSTTINNLEYPVALIELLSTYGGSHSYVVFGNEVTRGNLVDSYYKRTVAIIYAVDKPLFFVLE